MKRFNFIRNKYGSPLQADIGKIEKLPNYVLSNEPHFLSFYELLFITSGSGLFYLDTQPLKIAPRQVIFCAPSQSRQWQLEEPVKGTALFFEHEFISSFFQDTLFIQELSYFEPLSEQSAVILDAASFTKCIQMLEELQEELLNLKRDSNHIFRSLLYYLLIFLNRQVAGQQGGVLTQKQYLYKSFTQLMETKIAEWHRLQDYTETLGVSAQYLNQIVKDVTGETALNLIRRRLILEAKRRLLYSSHLTVAEIAFSLGFNDTSNFTRFFKNAEGISPKEFRSS